MEIEVIENKNNKLRFIVRGSNYTFINGLRRTIISEVPSLAIEDIILVENTSPVLDEMIAHRLGLVPLTTPADEFTVASECTNCEDACVIGAIKLRPPHDKEGQEMEITLNEIYCNLCGACLHACKVSGAIEIDRREVLSKGERTEIWDESVKKLTDKITS